MDTKDIKEKVLKSGRILLLVWGGLMVLNFLHRTQFSIGAKVFNPAVIGGEHKKIALPDNANPCQVIQLERAVGDTSSCFVASLQIDSDTATLIKGYFRGPMGASVSLGGQLIGMGISSPEFWVETESNMYYFLEERVYKVFVNFRRTNFLILNEQQTSLVGSLTLIINRQVKMSPSCKSQKKGDD